MVKLIMSIQNQCKTVVILCAGSGSRLKQFSEDYSKFQSSKSLLKLFYE